MNSRAKAPFAKAILSEISQGLCIQFVNRAYEAVFARPLIASP